jgi:dihydroorotate dehydrogenase electron transfer subunit
VTATAVSATVRGCFAVGSYTVIELDGDVEVGPPGTFAMVRDPGGAAFLPRPVGLFRRPDGTPAFLVDPAYSVGALVRATTLDVLSPLGSGFDLEGARADTTLLVGAGIGATVFFGLAAALGEPVRVVAGFREESQAAMLELIAPAGFREAALAPRLVTELVDLTGVELVLASGPGAMVRAVAALAAERGIACQVALEAPMACGFGACYGCAVELDGTWQRLCIEGPVVAAERLS